MATFLQENDILVLVCENENEMAHLSTEVAMTVGNDIGSGSLRHIQNLTDFKFQNIKSNSLLLFNIPATNINLFCEQKCSSNLNKLCKVCNRKRNVHALVSIPKTMENEFIFFLNALKKTTALKHEVQYVPGK